MGHGFRFVCLGALLVLTTHCGDDGGDGDGAAGMGTAGTGSEPLTPENLCDRVATVQCMGEQDCCSNPGRDFAACKSAQLDECNAGKLGDVASNEVTGYDSDAANQAFAELESRASSCDPAIAQWAVSQSGFLSAFLGTIDPGGDCVPDGGETAPTDELLAALSSCKDPETNACLPSMGSWTCSQRGDEGDSCFSDLNCKDGMTCLPALIGTCQPRKAVGEVYVGATECSTFLCKDNVCAEATADNAYCLAEL